jgi:hypothetical protein
MSRISETHKEKLQSDSYIQVRKSDNMTISSFSEYSIFFGTITNRNLS